MLRPPASCRRAGLFAACTTGALLLLLAAGCAQTQPPEVKGDERFGHRYEGETPDGRRTLLINQPDTSRTYFFYPALIDTIQIRQAPLTPALDGSVGTTDVEVLIKGSFPDACHALHAVEQERLGNLINVTLQMRRPQGAVCASVMRPYRFYLTLSGNYGVGNYTLKINEQVRPFVVRATVADTD